MEIKTTDEKPKKLFQGKCEDADENSLAKRVMLAGGFIDFD